MQFTKFFSSNNLNNTPSIIYFQLLLLIFNTISIQDGLATFGDSNQ